MVRRTSVTTVAIYPLVHCHDISQWSINFDCRLSILQNHICIRNASERIPDSHYCHTSCLIWSQLTLYPRTFFPLWLSESLVGRTSFSPRRRPHFKAETPLISDPLRYQKNRAMSKRESLDIKGALIANHTIQRHTKKKLFRRVICWERWEISRETPPLLGMVSKDKRSTRLSWVLNILLFPKRILRRNIGIFKRHRILDSFSPNAYVIV